MRILIMIMVIVIMMTGCSTTQIQESIDDVEKIPIEEVNTDEIVDNNEIESVEEMPSLDAVEVIMEEEEAELFPLEITINTLENTYVEEDKILAHVKIDYPIIQNELQEDGITKINQFFMESAYALYDENNTYAIDNVEMIKEEVLADNNFNNNYSEYKVTFQIKYNENGYLSILESFSETNYNTSTPNIYSTGYVFDVSTGERLGLGEIIEGTEDEIVQIVGQVFMNSDKIAEEVKKNYSEEILANTQYVEVYIDDQNINFFFNPYTVAPYSYGTLEADIPLNTDNLIKLNMNE
jgi:PBP1b-binding outer membrane lipoprotein LpoB